MAPRIPGPRSPGRVDTLLILQVQEAHQPPVIQELISVTLQQEVLMEAILADQPQFDEIPPSPILVVEPAIGVNHPLLAP